LSTGLLFEIYMRQPAKRYEYRASTSAIIAKTRSRNGGFCPFKILG
jgi:hypothetical protein